MSAAAGNPDPRRLSTARWIVPCAVFLLLAAGRTGAGGDSSRRETPLLEEILHSHPGLEKVAAAAPEHRLQVVLGRIEQTGGRKVLRQEGFRTGAEYFYPASTVKLFAAVAALELLAELRRETGLPIDADTALTFHPLFADEVQEDRDPGNLDGGRITVRQEIRKIFLVSDNQAFNRLYELVGQDRLAASLERAGLAGARIVHRLSEARTAEENRRFPRIDLRGEGFVHTLPERRSQPLPEAPDVAGLEAGRGRMEGGRLVEGPFDFSTKNRFPLAELQRGLCMVVLPDVDCGGTGFRLTGADRRLLLEAMGTLPGASRNPVYDPREFPDHFVKFVLPGLRRVVPAAALEIYDKSGQAYGFQTENALIVDTRDSRSFFLAATLYANGDGIVNDDRYDYDSVATPFLADLGEAVARRLWSDGER